MDSLKDVLGGSIRVRGFVDIINGDYKQLGKKNHFTIPLFLSLVSMMGNGSSTGVGNYPILPFGNWNTTTGIVPTMALGTDTTTTTKNGMVGLIAPIGGYPFVSPNSKSGSTGTLSNGASVTFSATWNAGTASGTVGEVGLYILYPTQAYYSIPTSGYNSGLWSFGGGYNSTVYQIPMMASRLSAADTDFTSFAINTAVPLTINWSIQLTFV